MENDHSYYTSRDFYTSACLLAAGLIVREINYQDGICFFQFESDVDSAELIVKRHWDGQLVLPTKSVTEAIYQLKNRMRQAGRA